MRLTMGIHAATHTDAKVTVAAPQFAFAFIIPTNVGPARVPHE